MGFRNPFRISVDKETGYVYVGDYGPDAGAPSPTRGPGGQVEFSVLRQAGQLRLALLHRRQRRLPRLRLRDRRSRARLFNCAAPVNASPRNTGAQTAAGGRAAGHLVRRRRPVGGGDAARRLGVADGRAGLPLRRVEPVRDQVPRLLRRPLVPVRVGPRLDQGDRARRRHGRPARGQRRSSTTPRSTGRSRWTWSSGPTARSTCSTTAPASSAGTPTRRSTASTTCRAAGARSRLWPPTRRRPARRR